MSAVVDETSIEVRRAQYVLERAQEIGAAIKREEYFESMQSAVWEALALENHWRAAVAYFSEMFIHRRLEDCRTVATILKTAASDTITIHKAILDKIEQACGSPRIDGRNDLILAHYEMQRIPKWIDSWPSSTAAMREAARAELVRGNACSAEEFVRSIESAGK